MCSLGAVPGVGEWLTCLIFSSGPSWFSSASVDVPHPFLFAECLWAGHLQMLCDTSGIRSLLVDISEQCLPRRPQVACISLQPRPQCFCSLSVLLLGSAPASIPWRELYFSAFSGNNDFVLKKGYLVVASFMSLPGLCFSQESLKAGLFEPVTLDVV